MHAWVDLGKANLGEIGELPPPLRHCPPHEWALEARAELQSNHDHQTQSLTNPTISPAIWRLQVLLRSQTFLKFTALLRLLVLTLSERSRLETGQIHVAIVLHSL